MCKKILVHNHFKSLKKNLDQSFDEEIEQCPATMMKRRPNTSSGQKKQKPRKVYKQRPAKCVLKEDSSGDLSSSEKPEEKSSLQK